jgi:hypothetical protein
MYAPFMNTAFKSEPIALLDWGFCVGVGVFIYTIIEVEKSIRNRFLKKTIPRRVS